MPRGPYQWEQFAPGRRGAGFWRKDSRPHIALSPNGRIAFNGAARDALGEPEFLALLLDRRSAVLGIQPTGPSDPFAVKVARDGNGQQYVNARMFFEWAELEIAVRRIIPGHLMGDTLVFRLTDGQERPTYARRKPRSIADFNGEAPLEAAG